MKFDKMENQKAAESAQKILYIEGLDDDDDDSGTN
jgi:hypothetical protein